MTEEKPDMTEEQATGLAALIAAIEADENPSFPVMAEAFPEFDQGTLPAIPSEWKESSWANDACPSFMAYDNGDDIFVQVFIDHANPEERELALPGTRYAVLTSTEAATGIFDSDDWAAILAHVAAEAARLNPSKA